MQFLFICDLVLMKERKKSVEVRGGCDVVFDSGGVVVQCSAV